MIYTIDVVPYLDGLARITQILGGAAAIWLGWKGLDTWRRQMRGTHDYELSRRILVSIYQVREGIQQVRNPFLASEEGYELRSAAEKEHGVDGIDTWEGYAYQERWNRFQEARVEFEANLLEAEAVWGEELKPLRKRIDDQVRYLSFATRQFLLSRRSPNESEAFTEKVRRALNDHSTENEPDDFAKTLTTTIVEFEKLLRPRLER